MGTWGTSTFACDAAVDFLDEQVERLCDFIRRDLIAARTDRVLERQTLAAVVCLRAILSAAVVPEEAAAMISSDEARSWRGDYLKWFDSAAKSMGGSEQTITLLRGNAESEFSKLFDHLGA